MSCPSAPVCLQKSLMSAFEGRDGRKKSNEPPNPPLVITVATAGAVGLSLDCVGRTTVTCARFFFVIDR